MSGQLDLFAAPKDKPEGLRYADAFVTKDEEAELIRTVAALPLQPFQFGAFEGKRRVTSFGFRYDYSEQRMKAALPIPDWISRLIGRVEAFGGANCAIRQVLCTEYAPGAGIGWHRDKPHFDEVFGLSLGSSCPFRFRRAAGKKWQRFTLEVAPRSLYAMTGSARHQWEHSIAPVATTRYSITFRTMARSY